MNISSSSPSSNPKFKAVSTISSPQQLFTANTVNESVRVAEISAHSLSSNYYSSNEIISTTNTSSSSISNTLENIKNRLSRSSLNVLSPPPPRDNGIKLVDDLLSMVKETKYLEQKDIAAAETERQQQKAREEMEKKRAEENAIAAALAVQREKELEAARIQSDKEAAIEVEASISLNAAATTAPEVIIINEALQALVIGRLKAEASESPSDLVRSFHSTQVSALRRFGLDESYSTSRWISNDLKDMCEWNFAFTSGRLSKLNVPDEIKSFWTKVISVNQWDSIATQVGSNQDALLQIIIDAHERDDKDSTHTVNDKSKDASLNSVVLSPCGDRTILVIDCIIASLITSLRRHPQNFSPKEPESLDMTPVAVSTTLRYLMRIDKDPTRGHFRKRFRAFLYLAAPCLAGSQISLSENPKLILDNGADEKEAHLVRAAMLFGFVINPSVTVEQQRQQEDNGLTADPLGLYTTLDPPWTVIARILNALRGHIRSLNPYRNSSNSKKAILGDTSIWVSLCCLQALILTSTDRLVQEIPHTIPKDNTYFGVRMGGPSQRGLQLLRATHTTLVSLKEVSKSTHSYWLSLEDALGLLIPTSQSSLSRPVFSLDGFNAKPEDDEDASVLKPSTFWANGRHGPFAAIALSGDADAAAE